MRRCAFPDGFTTWNAAAEAAVAKVAAGYNARFEQEAVMRTVAPACVAFVDER